MFGDKVEIVDQRFHGRVQPVAVAQLQGQAFADIAGHDANRLKPLTDLEDCLDIGGVGAERLRDLLKFSLAIPGLVGLIDETGANQLVGL